MSNERIAAGEPQASSAESLSGAQRGRAFPWRAADFAILVGWCALASTALLHHEKWADEAQAWVLVRDLSLSNLWLKELRYEGNPGEWHTLLWFLQRGFHLPYAGLGAVGLLCALAGVAFVLWRAPFPRAVRWLLVFSYYMIYQYAVIARPYVLLPLLAFLPALLFKDSDHPERMTVALILLINISLHGTLLAACIGIAYLVQAASRWKTLSAAVRRRYLFSAAAMLCMVVLLILVLKPPPDVAALQQVQHRFSAVAAGAWEGMRGTAFDNAPLTALWLALVAAWCFLRKGRALLTPVLILVLSVFYGFYGAPHHQGTIFVATVAGLWIGWPSAEEQRSQGRAEKQVHRALVAGLLCLFGYQAWNAAIAIRNDYLYPYCGAEDTAKYLKSVGADHQTIMGFGYGMVAVQAYFDHNIEVNLPTAYFHDSEAYMQGSANPMAELKRYNPEYVVVPCWEECAATLKSDIAPFMRDGGYSLVHFSDGYLFDKRGWDVRQAYLVYRRNH